MGRRGKSDGPSGFVVINKDPGWTSHDVVAKLRGIFGQRRTGHAGTLDPSATGVLIVGLGKATRLLRFLQATTKIYDGTFLLGSTTTTLDADGEVTGTYEMSNCSVDDIRARAQELTGELMQTPPMVSAIKVDGRRLHELAREGKEIERAPRPVSVSRFEVEHRSSLEYRFSISCSTGTYVRSLIDDLGRALGGGAHVTSLRRTAVGSFTLEDARTLDEIQALDHTDADWWGSSGVLLTPREGLKSLAEVMVDAEGESMVATGRPLERRGVAADDPGPYRVISAEGDLLGVYEASSPTAMTASVVLSGNG